MLVSKNFGVLHLPRSGGSDFRARLRLQQIGSLHDGVSSCSLDINCFYILLRDPKSWYLSFAAYASGYWTSHFDLERDNWKRNVQKLILGSDGNGKPYASSRAMGNLDARSWMRANSMGMWSCLVHHLVKDIQPNMTLNALWLRNRETDICDIQNKFGVPICSTRKINNSSHPDVSEIFDDELDELLSECDGYWLSKMTELQSGA